MDSAICVSYTFFRGIQYLIRLAQFQLQYVNYTFTCPLICIALTSSFFALSRPLDNLVAVTGVLEDSAETELMEHVCRPPYYDSNTSEPTLAIVFNDIFQSNDIDPYILNFYALESR